MNVDASFASQLYETARRMGKGDAPGAAPEPGRGTAFSDAMAAVAGEMGRTLQTAETTARDALAGRGDVQHVVEALTQAELALETAVTVRDRVVEAYQEVLRMPI